MPFVTLIGVLLGAAVAILAIIYILVPVLKGLGWALTHIFRFVAGEIGDSLRIVGGIVTTIVFVPLVLFSVVIGRWSSASHFGGAIKDEMAVIAHRFYRIVIGHPARLLGLTALTEGIEQRVPDAFAKAPGSDKPSKRTGVFEGYNIVGSIKGGGSGAKLYVAEPDQMKLAAFARMGKTNVDQVIIKSFSLSDGSSLPQIVRESRALEAAKDMGLVLEHDLSATRFFYVMPFVPGEDLTKVTLRLHSIAGPTGLGVSQLLEGIGHIADLAHTLSRYHSGGLWHKDVKPDNIIISNGRAHLVDLGLVTPLRSAMTLTTHGTEYFRDPELVRLALKGVKVHEVDGAKFDIYGLGAVLYSVVENSFPAHGGLSQVTKRCPESLRWVIRRAMTDYDRRYNSMAEFLADVRAIQGATDPFALLPKDLPSFNGDPIPMPEYEDEPESMPHSPKNFGAKEVAAAPMKDVFAGASAGRTRPTLVVTDWLTGRYRVSGQTPAGGNVHRASSPEPRARGGRPTPMIGRPTAKEQRQHARQRVHSARERAHIRMNQRRYSNSPNAGVFVAVGLFALLGVVALGAMGIASYDWMSKKQSVRVHVDERGAAEALAQESAQRATYYAQRGKEISDEITEAVESRVEELKGENGDIALPDVFRALARAATVERSEDSKGVLLILNDLQEDADVETNLGIRKNLHHLNKQGIDFLGLGDHERDVDLLAGARATIGNGLPTDAETMSRLSRWVQTEHEEIDGIIWILWSNDGRTVEYQLVGTDENVLRLAQKTLEAEEQR